MSVILKTEAIVLRTIKYGETSKIITFYTKESGRLSGIVKGARSTKNRFGASLEPMSYVHLLIYIKDSREIQTVGQCDLINSFHHFAGEMEKFSVGMSLIEMVNIVVHEQEQNTELFQLLIDSLKTLDGATKNHVQILYGFQIKLAEILGFAIQQHECAICGSSINDKKTNAKSILFNLIKGAPVCEKCDSGVKETARLSNQGMELLSRLLMLEHIRDSVLLDFDIVVNDEIEQFLSNYYQVHVSGFRKLRSRMLFS